jgi:bacteriocin biosynthesis cyclodehydratase domain-containing protein
MADAVRMTALADSAQIFPTVISGGAFGRRVAGFLTDNEAGNQVAHDEPVDGDALESAFDPQNDAIVIALSRPNLELCQSADRLAFERNRIWLPIIMEHPVIRIGPLVRPPGGPCFTCSQRRRVQHELDDELGTVVKAAYAADRVWGPEGYLPHHARLAAAIGHGLLLASGRGDGRVSDKALDSVLTIQLLNNCISQDRVVSCHDCGQCAPAQHSDAAGGSDWVPQDSKRLKRYVLETLRKRDGGQ